MSDDPRVQDILDAASRLEEIVAEGREAFDASHVLEAAALYNVQIIGEAAARLSEDARAEHPDIPWREVIGMRNIIVHAYFDVDLDEVWATITRDVPDLRMRLGP